jgi:hypothetical protein
MGTLKGVVKLALALTLALLLTGVVGVAQAAEAPVDKTVGRADVTVVIMPQPAAEGRLVYDVIATNRGHTWAKDTTITLPFNPAALKLFDTQFSGNAGWIKEVKSNSLVINIPRLDASGKTTATLRFSKLAPDAALTERAAFTWSDGIKGGSGSTNLPQAVAKPFYPMGMSQVAGAATPTMQFGSDLFAPGEPVSFWCNMPDSEIHELLIGSGADVWLEHRVSDKEKDEHTFGDYMRADGNGAFTVNFAEEGLTPGSYSVVAYGHWTGLTAVAPFELK